LQTFKHWIKALIKLSSKSIIHFGGLEFSPHQHPRSIEFDETYDVYKKRPLSSLEIKGKDFYECMNA